MVDVYHFNNRVQRLMAKLGQAVFDSYSEIYPTGLGKMFLVLGRVSLWKYIMTRHCKMPWTNLLKGSWNV